MESHFRIVSIWPFPYRRLTGSRDHFRLARQREGLLFMLPGRSFEGNETQPNAGAIERPSESK